MNKKIIIISIVLLVLVLLVGGLFWFFKGSGTDPNSEAPDLVETPPTVNKVNSLPR